MNPGGKGANQAVAATKLGADVTFACKLGNDIFGKQAIAGFKEAGINTGFIITDIHHPSGVALILVDDKGENSISVALGANGHLQADELEALFNQVQPNDILLIQLEIPIPTVEQTIQKCHSRGAKVILNPAPSGIINESVFRFINIITPNETEAGLLTGVKVDSLENAEMAATILQNKGVENVIITLGAKGAYLQNNKVKKLIAAPIVQAVDTTAAGDVFNGALAVALSENTGLEEAIVFACKAASVAVTRMGAQSSAPVRNEL